MSINLHGIGSRTGRRRARLTLRLHCAPGRSWMMIVPLNRQESPFTLCGTELELDGVPVAEAERIDPDDAVGGYFRDNGRAITLNPNARSRCTGCAFCPNTLEAAADPRLTQELQLNELLTAMAAEHPRGNLSGVREVTVSTGCFEHEHRAVEHLRALRTALSRHAPGARIGLLTSVITSAEAFASLSAHVAPFVLRLTVECFSRRELMLKSSKAALTPAVMPSVLDKAMAAGLDTSYTYIVGLDPVDELERGIANLAARVTEFPNFQVFQAHNTLMQGLRVQGASDLRYYLSARRAIEQVMAPSGLRPAAWECYRPLWFTTFDGKPLARAA
jgi:hypothetical protein